MNQWFKIALYAFMGIILGTFLLGIVTPANQMNIGSAGQWNLSGQEGSSQYWMDYKMGPGYVDMNMSGMGMGMRGGMGMHGRR